MDINQQRYEECYKPLVEEYLNRLKAKFPKEEYRLVPNLFLPAWGKGYFAAPVRMVFVGRDTRGWGNGVASMIDDVESGDWSGIFDMSEFQNLNYTTADWGTKSRYTYWGFVLYFLAWLNGIEDWQVLKNAKSHRDLLSSFGWGNVNSIERSDSQRIKEAFSRPESPLKSEVYSFAKSESRVFDDFSFLQKVMEPDVVFIMCYDKVVRDTDRYLSRVEKSVLLDEDALRAYQVGKTLVINIPHPQAIMRRRDGKKADYYVKRLIELLSGCNHSALSKEAFREDEKFARDLLAGFSVGLKTRASTTFDAVKLIATELQKQSATMTVRKLSEVLNREGYTTTYGNPYSGGRGTYRMVSCAYDHFFDTERDVAEAIAVGFTRDDGGYAYAP